ncbi:hypothetical protein N7462_011696 [Penicillium macrosclerotiorum]|uniref:uncharacterized protein n=1 Tax=Penicillium macrosclerotiorum TaxID=303699 RepID=UPI00254685FF|nr:uncharacterized protein N7462_011696 [Penicillium macrosclerotiorum]KAJ5662770.1 hypothetical protein N7462_011696 [Penicillium macrosclerotiorum]
MVVQKSWESSIVTAWPAKMQDDRNAQHVVVSSAAPRADPDPSETHPMVSTEAYSLRMQSRNIQLQRDSSHSNDQGSSDNGTASDTVQPVHLSINGQSARHTIQANAGPEDLKDYIPVGVLGQNGSTNNGSLQKEISLLETHNWIRTHFQHKGVISANLRVYVDPRMASRYNSQRSVTKLRAALKSVMGALDRCPEAWEGWRPPQTPDGDLANGADDESLWYMFNTLQDPNPQVNNMKEEWSRRAMELLLSDEDFSDLGLKTRLYPYQRRSAATMIQREAQPAQMLDPRLQECKSPTGAVYYYDKEDAHLTLDKVLYSEACGGILAETMGCGKTLICLAVIWATRGHFPRIPIEYIATPDKPDLTPVREKTGSLMTMAAAAVGRNSEPWKTFFLEKQQQGAFYDRCLKACEANRGFYEIPPHQTRYQGRHSGSYPRPPAKRIRLCSATLIIVPNNLMDHWQREINTHIEGLDVLVLRQGSDKTPSADQLLNYDIVLFSKSRFEREAGEPVHNRRDRLVQIDSPLTQLHWLRVIVDEGHNVAGHGSKTNMIHMLGQLHFERRWVISGTPSTGLYGVEVSLASQEANTSDTEASEEMTAAALRGRKKTGNAADNELKDLDRLRRIVIEFLGLKPWANSRAEDPADWTKYIKPIGEDGKRRKTPAMRATLQGLVVRHRLDVVSLEITIPKLYNRVVYLEPTFHDRLSINLFLFGLAVNSITSERQGPDYIFDPSNWKHLNQTINNLRQAGFWWAGSDVNPQDSIDHALKYLDSNREKMTSGDIQQLVQGIDIAQRALNSRSWHEYKNLHELGVYVRGFPEDHRAHWALDGADPEKEPFLIGITQACRAQQFVTQNLKLSDPTLGLSGAGIKARSELKRRDKRAATKGAPESTTSPTTPGSMSHSPKPKNIKSPKKTFTKNLFHTLASDSPLQKTQFVATASAKLTYLLDQVSKFQASEKIIIFYDNNNSAFWIAEGLELLGVEFRIYASTLKPELRTEYLRLFREADDVRVLLMDLRQASHGLHIAQASRVFIVNPIWQPNVESQAIKRAHRIGQTRPVYVETLVLRDTLEDRMLYRRKEMSDEEIQNAEKSLLDDNTMSHIIQKEPFLPMGDEDSTAAAYLDYSSGFFNRHKLPIPDDEVMGLRELPKMKRLHGIEGSDADTDSDVAIMSGSPIPKRPRLGFASDVQILGDEPVSESAQPSFSKSPPVSTGSVDFGKKDEGRRISLFGGP